MRLAVPSYFYPGPEWDRLLRTKPAIAVINPASGPGERIDENYEALVQKLKRADIRVLGYIATTWAKADTAGIATQQTRYRKWYKVADFFYDEGATASDAVRYYEPLVSPCLVPVLNPGTFPDESYMGLRKAIHMIYETSMDKYLAKEPPAWVRKYPANKFWHCVFGVPTLEEAMEVARVARKRKAGYIYISDDIMGEDDNPYDSLPAYWEELVPLVKRL